MKWKDFILLIKGWLFRMKICKTRDREPHVSHRKRKKSSFPKFQEKLYASWGKYSYLSN